MGKFLNVHVSAQQYTVKADDHPPESWVCWRFFPQGSFSWTLWNHVIMLEGSVGFLFEESHGVMHPARSDFFSWKGPFFFFQTSFNSLLWKSKNNQCIFLVHTSGSRTRMDLTGSGIPRKPGLNGVCRRVDLSSCCVFPLEWPAWSYQKYETRGRGFHWIRWNYKLDTLIHTQTD